MENKTICDNDMNLTSLQEKFDDIFADIKMGVDKGWLPQRNLMYIKDIKDMYERQERFKDAGDNIDTIIYYVQEGENEADTEGDTRQLLTELGELQSELHKKSDYYSE